MAPDTAAWYRCPDHGWERHACCGRAALNVGGRYGEPPTTAAWPYPALYFGCWRSVGHGYYAPGMGSANYKTHSSELTPWGDHIDGRFTPKSTSKQGAARLTYNEGWTVLSIHDYTVDSRGGSHSTFAFVGTLDYDEAVAAATEHFPEVMRRLGAIERVGR